MLQVVACWASSGRMSGPSLDRTRYTNDRGPEGYIPVNDLGGQKADLPDKYQCTKRLFCSQDTPEAAPEQAGLSQDTVKEVIKDAMAPKESKKTGRKRYKRKADFDSNSQPVSGTKSKPPHRVMDRAPIPDWHSVHHMGKAMMPSRLVKLFTGDMRSLHDGVLYQDERLLKEKDPTYPVFFAKVPEIDALGFITKDSRDMPNSFVDPCMPASYVGKILECLSTCVRRFDRSVRLGRTS